MNSVSDTMLGGCGLSSIWTFRRVLDIRSSPTGGYARSRCLRLSWFPSLDVELCLWPALRLVGRLAVRP